MSDGELGFYYVVGSLVFILLIMILYLISSQMMIARQNRTIDKLTDKILGIQVTKEKPTIKEDDVSPVKEDEKLSWHDS